jgi:oxygen-independent coproporphyrinogen-3 oxidase
VIHSLYIHIPFCAVRCHYCDFNTYAGLEKYYEPYTVALQKEIRRAGAEYGRSPIRTIFVGGGTPTVLPAQLLADVLDTCREAFPVTGDAEITSEANPGTVDQEHFSALRAMGVNRLSMGVQSFDDAELRWLGRIHSAEEAVAAFAAARAAGFSNINLDFISGLPDQDPGRWMRTLARAIELGPEHLSLYSLTVEQGTPLADWVRKGKVAAPDDDLAADLYIAAQNALATAGYEQYEISNWAQPGRSCRHNLVYWRDEGYLGFGAGAHSYGDGHRWWNVRPIPHYIRRVSEGQSPAAGSETIDRALEMGETMMLGLRLAIEGVSEERFHSRFGITLDEAFGEEIAELAERRLIERLPDRVRLTVQGRLLGNQVFARFLP